MFMDGTIYAAVASNLSQGNGSFWSLKFSETIMNPFYEHPPLAIWMESSFHWLFNDSMWSERIYSLAMWLLNAGLIMKIWEQLRPNSPVKWVPILLWSMLPIVVWSFSNNMLENTMGVFVSSSVLFFLKGMKSRTVLWNGLSGAMLTLAFLSKGFVGLFPFALPLLYTLFFFRERSLVQHLLSGFYMLLGFLLLLAPFLMNSVSNEFLMIYLDHQVKNSVEHIQTVSHRFRILEYFLIQVFLPLAIGALVFFAAKSKAPLGASNKKWAGLLLVLSLCGVLPIMISLKQRDFYILTVYPFAILAIVLFVENGFLSLHKGLMKRIKKPQWLVITMFFLAVALAIGSSSVYKRDKEILRGIEALEESEFSDRILHCSNNIRHDWSTMAYLSRIAKISVEVGYESDYKLTFSNEESSGLAIQFHGLKISKRDKQGN